MNNSGKVRPYQPADYAAVKNIYISTGYTGRALRKDLFSDFDLFAMLYLDCYARFYTGHFFVYESAGTVYGYINGAPDTVEFNTRYRREQIPRITDALAALPAGSERERRITEAVLADAQSEDDVLAPIISAYPAHLHINVSPDAHRNQIGTRLLERYEQHCREQHLPGVHLITSNYNTKACPFYEKHGYVQHLKIPGSKWPGLDDCCSIVYAKKL